MVTFQFFILYKKTSLLLLCCAATIIMGSGCTLHKIRSIEINDLTLKNEINQSITDAYPDRFKAIHRVILTIAGKNYVLNGYLFVDRPGREIKLTAQNDLGGIIFDLHFIKNLKKKINVNVNMIKQEWLENSVLRDLEILYLAKPFVSPLLFSDQNDNFILSKEDGQITQQFIYKQIQKPLKYRLMKIRHMKNGKCVYMADFKYGTAADNLYPDVIIIKDTKMEYNLQINVRYF